MNELLARLRSADGTTARQPSLGRMRGRGGWLGEAGLPSRSPCLHERRLEARVGIGRLSR